VEKDKRDCYTSRYCSVTIPRQLHTIIKIDVLISDEPVLFLYRKSRPESCGKSQDPESPYYQQLNTCIVRTRS
jgi:hypothetical protein